MGIRSFQVGVGFKDEDGNPVDDFGRPLEVTKQAPLILTGPNGQPADGIASRADMIQIMSSNRYRTDARFRDAVGKLIEASDPVALGLEAEQPEGNAMLDAAYLEAKQSYVKNIFGSDAYKNDPNVRYQTMLAIANNPEMANQLSEGRIIEHGEGMSVVIDSNKPSNSNSDQK